MCVFGRNITLPYHIKMSALHDKLIAELGPSNIHTHNGMQYTYVTDQSLLIPNMYKKYDILALHSTNGVRYYIFEKQSWSFNNFLIPILIVVIGAISYYV